MTNTEAKGNLIDIRNKYLANYGEDSIINILIDEYDIQAIDMAIQALEQEPCEDAISREELLKAIDTWDRFGVDDTNSLFRLDNLSLPHYVAYIHYDDVVKCIKGMPSVKPQVQTGHWIGTAYDGYADGYPVYYMWECSECGHEHSGESGTLTDFCPDCGARMVEP